MTKKIELYQYWRSSCSWRIRWGLNLKNVDYATRSINLLKGEQKDSTYLKLNPNASVPAIVIDGESFGESLAILEWLDEQFPKPQLLPSSFTDRLRVRQMALSIVAGTQPLQNLSVQKYFSDDTDKRKAYAKHWIENGLAIYENLAREFSGSYSFGSSVTIADLCLIPQVYNAERFGVDMNLFPTIKKINTLCLSRDDCQKAHPSNQPDATN